MLAVLYPDHHRSFRGIVGSQAVGERMVGGQRYIAVLGDAVWVGGVQDDRVGEGSCI